MQEPVVDELGQRVSGIRYSLDGEGASVRNRLWRGYFITDFDGIENRYTRLCEQFQPRSDDIFIVAYLKCGTHWLHEICHFVLTRQASQRPASKEDVMLECRDFEDFESLPSPRVLNCHQRFSLLPEKVANSSKIVYVVRNPKDTMVSLYHHYISISDYEYSGTFKGFLHLYETGQLDAGSWFEHTRDFLQAIDSGRNPNILMVEYEKLKKSPRSEILRIAGFLLGDAVDEIDDSLLDEICQKVSFQSMREARSEEKRELFNAKAEAGFYRKGEVGDWRNWMSEDVSDTIDRLTEKALDGLEHLYRPIYE